MYWYKRKHWKPVHNTLPSGLRICFRIERGYKEIFPKREKIKEPKWSENFTL